MQRYTSIEVVYTQAIKLSLSEICVEHFKSSIGSLYMSNISAFLRELSADAHYQMQGWYRLT